MSPGENKKFVEKLVKTDKIISNSIIKAFLVVDRIDFVPSGYESDAYLDVPIPLHAGMTTSQPGTIAFMLEKIQPEWGEKVLEIGTGSGYMTALLAYLVGPSGEVVSFEYEEEIKRMAEQNLSKYLFRNIHLVGGDGKDGLAEEAPWDIIVSSAEAKEIPIAWKDQLAINGRILTPYDRGLVLLKKVSNDRYLERRFPGFAFVPLK